MDAEKINVDTYDPSQSEFEIGSSRLQNTMLKENFENKSKSWSQKEIEPIATSFMLNISKKEFKALLKENTDRQSKGKKPRIADINTLTTYTMVTKYLEDAFVGSNGFLSNSVAKDLLNVHKFDHWVYQNQSTFGEELPQFTPTEDNIDINDRMTMSKSTETITTNDKRKQGEEVPKQQTSEEKETESDM